MVVFPLRDLGRVCVGLCLFVRGEGYVGEAGWLPGCLPDCLTGWLLGWFSGVVPVVRNLGRLWHGSCLLLRREWGFAFGVPVFCVIGVVWGVVVVPFYGGEERG